MWSNIMFIIKQVCELRSMTLKFSNAKNMCPSLSFWVQMAI